MRELFIYAGHSDWLVQMGGVFAYYRSRVQFVIHSVTKTSHNQRHAKLTNRCGQTYTATPYIVELCEL